jgi:ATP-dependent Clp protease adaptor protein ClpS
MSRELLKQEEWAEVLDDIGTPATLLLFNDDVNTFDHVIECLIRICKHEPLQAEQSALIVHFKGKCVVKTGEYSELAAMCQALCDEDLSAAMGE